MSDLFAFFSKANAGDYQYVDRMSEEEVKAISPFVLTMWGNNAKKNTEMHAIMTDTYMNDKVFPLAKHPRLLLKLFIAANSGIDDTRYAFLKAGASKSSKAVESIADFYNCTLTEARDYAKILTDDDKKWLMERKDAKSK